MAHSLQRWACAVLDCVQFHLIDQRYQRHVLELCGDAPAPLRWQQVTGAVDLWDQQGASPVPHCRCLICFVGCVDVCCRWALQDRVHQVQPRGSAPGQLSG